MSRGPEPLLGFRSYLPYDSLKVYHESGAPSEIIRASTDYKKAPHTPSSEWSLVGMESHFGDDLFEEWLATLPSPPPSLVAWPQAPPTHEAPLAVSTCDHAPYNFVDMLSTNVDTRPPAMCPPTMGDTTPGGLVSRPRRRYPSLVSTAPTTLPSAPWPPPPEPSAEAVRTMNAEHADHTDHGRSRIYYDRDARTWRYSCSSRAYCPGGVFTAHERA
jgi:hypothetical protein